MASKRLEEEQRVVRSKMDKPRNLKYWTIVLIGFSLLAQQVHAQYDHIVSGPITGEVTLWGKVLLTGDVTVTATGRLILLPGTRVESVVNTDDQQGGYDPSHVELIVQPGGWLIAKGTPDSPILFTSSSLTPQKGDWYGLRFNGDYLLLRYCTQEWGLSGLRLEGGNPDRLIVERCTVRRNLIDGITVQLDNARLNLCIASENDSSGIVVYDNRTCTLTGCTVRENGWHGVYSPSATVIAVNCIASNNGGSGMSAFMGHFIVSNTIASNNGIYGIYVPYGTMTLTNSIINHNAQTGIYASPSILTLINNTITSNGRQGIYAQRANVTLINNTISNNRTSGLFFFVVGTDGLKGNLIQGNLEDGVQSYRLEGENNSIIGNDILMNGRYEWRNARSGTVVAEGNYWGEPTTTELNQGVVNLTKIYDSRDDAEVGPVNIPTWLKSRATGGLRGTVRIEDYVGDSTRVPITIELRRQGGGSEPTRVVFLDSDGSFRFEPVPAGTYDLAFRGPTWLRKVMAGVEIQGGEFTEVSPVVLLNGDANGDNVVDDSDLALVLLNFGLFLMPGDLDGNEVVNDADLALVLRNYGLQGDP